MVHVPSIRGLRNVEMEHFKTMARRIAEIIVKCLGANGNPGVLQYNPRTSAPQHAYHQHRRERLLSLALTVQLNVKSTTLFTTSASEAELVGFW